MILPVRPTLVKKGATLGANCTIVCGHTIGRYAFIGAGAVVTKDVPDHALMVGNPAKQIGWMCECGERLDAGGICKICGCPQTSSCFDMLKHGQPSKRWFIIVVEQQLRRLKDVIPHDYFKKKR